MARDWEKTFDAWGSPPSQAEADERDRTEAEIADALRAHRPLQDKKLRVYPKGSYRRGTNVRRGSDVDIAVELLGDTSTGDSWHYEKAFAAEHLSDQDLGVVTVNFSYTVEELKDDVEAALRTAFGAAVKRSDKCIKIREKATTLPADVVPCRTFRRFDDRNTSNFGIKIVPDRTPPIINYPQQDDDNGKRKNDATRLRFKRVVRGIKSLENEMVDNNVIEPVPSFMMECAVFNLGPSGFSTSSNFQNCVEALRLMRQAITDASCRDWTEVNDLKYLFRGRQAWTIDDLQRLVETALPYLDT